MRATRRSAWAGQVGSGGDDGGQVGPPGAGPGQQVRVEGDEPLEPEVADLVVGGGEVAVVVDPHVRRGAALLVGRLPRDPVARVRLGQPALLDEPPDAGLRVRADDDGQVLSGPEPALDEQRHVVDRDRLDVRRGPLFLDPGRDRRTGDPVEVGQRLRVREHDGGQCRRGRATRRDGPAEGRSARRSGPGSGCPGSTTSRATTSRVDDVRTEVTKRGRDRRLARTDPPGETDVEHLARLGPAGPSRHSGRPHRVGLPPHHRPATAATASSALPTGRRTVSATTSRDPSW